MDKTILIPVLSEDIAEDAIKMLEEIPKVLNTTELGEHAKTTEPGDTVKHKVEGKAVLTPRAPDGRAVLSEDTTEEAVVPLTSSELLPIVVELNQDTTQKILSEKIPEEWDKEVVEVQKITTNLVVMFLDKSPQLDEARERTPGTSSAVEETKQRRTPCLAELIAKKLFTENPQLAMARKKTYAKAKRKKVPDEANKSDQGIQRQLTGELAQERPRPSNPTPPWLSSSNPPAPPQASRPPRRRKRWSRTRPWMRRLSRCWRRPTRALNIAIQTL